MRERDASEHGVGIFQGDVILQGTISCLPEVLTRVSPVPDRFCELCKLPILVLDSSANLPYRYSKVLYELYEISTLITLGKDILYLHNNTCLQVSVSVHFHTVADRFCKFYNTSITVAGGSMNSVRNLIPYRTYPYTTKHNLKYFLSIIQVMDYIFLMIPLLLMINETSTSETSAWTTAEVLSITSFSMGSLKRVLLLPHTPLQCANSVFFKR